MASPAAPAAHIVPLGVPGRGPSQLSAYTRRSLAPTVPSQLPVILPLETPIVPTEGEPVQLTYRNGQPFGVADDQGVVHLQQQIHLPIERQKAVHFCGWRQCHMRLCGEGKVLASAIDHLPVCHRTCWKQERDRFMKQSGGQQQELPLCHRKCYHEAVWRMQHPRSRKEVVPYQRTVRERVESHVKCEWRRRQEAMWAAEDKVGGGLYMNL